MNIRRKAACYIINHGALLYYKQTPIVTNIDFKQTF